MVKTNKKQYILNMIAILMIFSFGSAGSYLGAAVQSFMDAWPGVSMTTIMLVNTLPALASMPVMVIVGSVVGKKLSYKMASILGSLCIVIGGVLPFFYAPSWSFVLVCRVITGIGAGFYGMRSALLVQSCKPEDQARLIGYGNAIYSIGSMLISPIVGALVVHNWQNAFVVNLFPVVMVVLTVLFMIEPENGAVKEDHAETSSRDAVPVSAKLDKRIVLYWVMQLLATGSVYPLLSLISVFMTDKGLGDAALSGMVLSAYTLGAAVAGFALVLMQNIFKRKCSSACYFLTAIGQALVLFIPSVPTAFIGAFLTGFGFMLGFSLLIYYIGLVCHPSKVGFASTVMMLVNQGGIFVSTYLILFANMIFGRTASYENAWLFNIVIQVVFGIIMLFGTLVPENKK